MNKFLKPLTYVILLGTITAPLLAQTPAPKNAEHPADPAAASNTSRVLPRGVRPGMTAAQMAAAQAAIAGDPFVKDPAGAGNSVRAASGDVTGAGTIALDVKVAAPPPPENYQILFEYYDLTRADYAALLQENDGDDTALYARIQEWMGHKHAKLAQFFAATGKPGNRSVIESIDEFRYPIEFEPPIAEDDAPQPTTYETRNTGQTLEWEYNLLEGGRGGTLAFALNHPRLTNYKDHVALPGRQNSGVSQPDFTTRKFSTTLTLPTDAPRFAGTLSAANDDTTPSETVRLVFVRVRPCPHGKKTAPIQGVPLVRLEYTFYSLERAAARDVLLANADPEQCHATLQKLVQNRQAQLEHICTNVTLQGNRAVTEELVEMRYGIEFEPPSFPESKAGGASMNDSGSGDHSHGSEPPAAPGAAQKAPAPPPASVARNSARQQVVVANPLPPSAFPKNAPIPPIVSTFESRNAGFSVEIEPEWVPDRMLTTVNVVPQFVRYVGEAPVSGIGKIYPPTPLFETRKFTGSFFCVPGQHEFVSTFNVPIDSGAKTTVDDGRVTLGFIRAVPVK